MRRILLARATKLRSLWSGGELSERCIRSVLKEKPIDRGKLKSDLQFYQSNQYNNKKVRDTNLTAVLLLENIHEHYLSLGHYPLGVPVLPHALEYKDPTESRNLLLQQSDSQAREYAIEAGLDCLRMPECEFFIVCRYTRSLQLLRGRHIASRLGVLRHISTRILS